MLAAGAGYIHLAAAPCQPQQRPALGAFKIFILLAIFLPLNKLAAFGADIAGKGQIFLIFRHPLSPIAGKHAEDGVKI